MMKTENRRGGGEGASSPLARIFRNARALLSGKAAGGVLSLAYLAIAARGLGPEGVGALVLAHAYALVVAGIARFQSWQAVIRFGAPMIEAGEAGAFKRLLRYTIRLDLLSGVLSVAIALAAAPHAARAFGWDDEIVRLIQVYCFAVPFLIAATPTGVLRLFDRFDVLGWQLLIMPGTRFVGAVYLWLAGGGLAAFMAVWIASVFLHGLSLWALGLTELGKRKLTPAVVGRASAPADRAWLPFMVKTNLSSSIDLMHNQLPILIVGGVLGSAAAGFFKVAFNLANLLAQPVNMLNQAMFPEFSKVQVADGDSAVARIAFRSIGAALAIAAPIIALYVLFRRDLAVMVGGDAFLPAAPLIALMAAAQAFRIGALGLESAALARGRAGWALGGQGGAAFVHLGALAIGLGALGVAAAPLAIMAGWAALIVILLAAVLYR